MSSQSVKPDLLAQFFPNLPRRQSVEHRDRKAGVATLTTGPRPAAATPVIPPMTAEDIRRMDEEEDERLDRLPFPADVEEMERMEAGLSLADEQMTRTRCNGLVSVIGEVGTPEAVQRAREAYPSPTLSVVALEDIIEKSPVERTKARGQTRQEKMKTVTAMAEWIYDVTWDMIDSGALTAPWSSYSDVHYRPRELTVARIGTMLTSFQELPASVPVLAVFFTRKLAVAMKQSEPLSDALLDDGGLCADEFIVRVFTIGLIMADKALVERGFALQTWSEVSGVPFATICKMERSAVQALDYNLSVGAPEWEIHLKGLLAQTTQHALTLVDAPRVPPSVILACILRDLLATADRGYKQSSPVYYNSLSRGTISWLEKQWRGRMVPASPQYLTVTTSTEPSYAQPLNHSEPIRPGAYGKRKHSATSEWITARDPVTTPSTRKAPRTSLHTAIGTERERVRRAEWESVRPGWTSLANLAAPTNTAAEPRRSTSQWGSVQPWGVLQDPIAVQKLVQPLVRTGHALRSAARLMPLTAIHTHH